MVSGVRLRGRLGVEIASYLFRELWYQREVCFKGFFIGLLQKFWLRAPYLCYEGFMEGCLMVLILQDIKILI